jgi:hypothetical protein
MHAYMYTYTYKYKYTQIYTYAYIYIHIHIHIYTHTHTGAPISRALVDQLVHVPAVYFPSFYAFKAVVEGLCLKSVKRDLA